MDNRSKKFAFIPFCLIAQAYQAIGMEKRRGLFIPKLYENIKDLNIPIIGINRKYINKSLNELEKIMNGVKS